jgi:NADP-dependent 3-hydroxy acid dehydrogenase YdfG
VSDALPLAGRGALVTGASRGIGLAVARRLAAAGARVAMLARGAEALAARAGELGGQALPIPCDVRDRVAVERATATIRLVLGAPDIIVNNAGAFQVASFDETTPTDFAAMLDANLVAPFLFTSAFLAEMRTRGSGHVLTIGSVADRVAFPGNASYAASKFGLRGLHEVLRAELRGSGVRATLVSPAAVDTGLWDEIDPDSREGFTPRAAMLSAVAVADAVLYAVSCPPTVNVDELRLSRA